MAKKSFALQSSLACQEQGSLKSFFSNFFLLVFFFFWDLFGLQSVMIDGTAKCGLLWASATLKCMGKKEDGEQTERWDGRTGADIWEEGWTSVIDVWEERRDWRHARGLRWPKRIYTVGGLNTGPPSAWDPSLSVGGKDCLPLIIQKCTTGSEGNGGLSVDMWKCSTSYSICHLVWQWCITQLKQGFLILLSPNHKYRLTCFNDNEKKQEPPDYAAKLIIHSDGIGLFFFLNGCFDCEQKDTINV